MVWSGITLDALTSLHVFERGSLIGVRYRDEVLEPCVLLFRSSCGLEFILMDDNARPRRVLLVNAFLEREDICYIDWPARSPYLNLTEHAWETLRRAIATRNPLREPPRK
ncbi:transposable element Tcb2 transposase [Trichonephila clavipes]|nr:transposable element Tcb2 transposase [Trichonephila clavipes]